MRGIWLSKEDWIWMVSVRTSNAEAIKKDHGLTWALAFLASIKWEQKEHAEAATAKFYQAQSIT